MSIVNHDYFILEFENNKVYITVNKPDYPMLEFSKFIKDYPRVKVTAVMELKKAFDEHSGEKTYIGELKPLIQCRISKDKMKATIQINTTPGEIESNRTDWKSRVLVELQNSGVKEGIVLEELNKLTPLKEIIIAKGIPAIDGEKAKISYYEFSKKSPVIREEGTANYYEMNFIDGVEVGEWLGEKIPPTDGVEGRMVTGEPIRPKKGKDVPLRYDKKTVEEIEEEDGRTVLRARVNGAVSFKRNRITVGTHLRIDGDVGFGTGNIDFDGSVEIVGTVLEGFSVKATQDVSVLSNMGIQAAKCIESTGGNIYIKGGVFGRNQTVVKAAKSIFIKHANECILEAGKDVNVGFYSIGSKIKAECLLAEERIGRIIGGEVKAKYFVKSGQIGNKAGTKTYVHVDGFNRKEIQQQVSDLLMDYKKKLKSQEELERKIEVYEKFKAKLSKEHQTEYKKLLEQKDEVKQEIVQFEEHRQALGRVLEVKGEGQVLALKCMFPDVFVTIKNSTKHMKSDFLGSLYYQTKEILMEPLGSQKSS